MSKSFNNFLSIQDAIAKYHPETIRYAILSHHYSANIDFSEKTFYDAYHRLIYFYTTFQRIEELVSQVTEYESSVPDGIEPPQVEALFIKAMDDDFNTALALAHIGTAFKFLNDFLASKKPKLKQKMYLLTRIMAEIRKCAGVLGLLKKSPETALADIQRYLVKARNIDTQEISDRIEARNAARSDRDWAEADRIRDELIGRGIQIRDTPNGTQWHVEP